MRPIFTNVIYLAFVFFAVGMLLLLTEGIHGQAKASFQYSIGFASAFLTVAMIFARMDFGEAVEQGQMRAFSLNVASLVTFSGVLILGTTLMLDTTVFTNSVYEGIVTGFVGHGSGLMMAFANSGK